MSDLSNPEGEQPAFSGLLGSAAWLRYEAEKYDLLTKIFGAEDVADEARQKEHSAALRTAADTMDRVEKNAADLWEMCISLKKHAEEAQRIYGVHAEAIIEAADDVLARVNCPPNRKAD